jgi:hypothetical protein
MWLEAEYRGRFMQLTGFYEPNDGARHTTNQVQLEVRDYGGERHLRGSIGAGQVPTIGWAGILSGISGDAHGRIIGDFAVHEGDHLIDLTYNSGRLYGSLNGQRFALQVDGDDALAGTVTVAGNAHDFTLRDVSRLWALPVADQAAILPMLLSCKLTDRDPMPAGVAHLQLAPTLTFSTVGGRRWSVLATMASKVVRERRYLPSSGRPAKLEVRPAMSRRRGRKVATTTW